MSPANHLEELINNIENFHAGVSPLTVLKNLKLEAEDKTPKSTDADPNADHVVDQAKANFHAGNYHAGESNFHAGNSNFHVGDGNFHAGNFHAGGSNFHAGTENFHAGNFHAGESNFHAGNFHAGNNFHAGGDNFHAGNLHAGNSNFHAGRQNFHAGNFHAGESNFHAGDSNFHAGNFHAGKANFHAGTDNFHAGKNNFHAGENNFHAGELNFHAGKTNLHAGNFHSGMTCDAGQNNFHAGNFHAGRQNFHAGNGNFHAGNFHAGKENFHAGSFHAGENNFHAGTENFHAGNFHAGEDNFHAGRQNFHAGDGNFHAGNFHAGRKNFHAGEGDSSIAVDHFRAGPHPEAEAASNIEASAGPSIESTVRFFTGLTSNETPFNYVERPADGRFNNLQSQEEQIKVADIAQNPSSFNISKHAFACLPQVLPVQGRYDWKNDNDIKSNLYPKIVSLLSSRLAAKKIVLFDHTIRVQGGNRAPVTQAHIDQTPASAIARLWRHLPPSEAMNMKDRVRLVNVWLPINGKVERDPLAFVDSATLRDDDLVAVEHRYPTWTGETYVVKHNPEQKWYVWGGMEDGDALLLCCYDSSTGVRCAHAAIADPRSVAGAKVRESIEVRALVSG